MESFSAGQKKRARANVGMRGNQLKAARKRCEEKAREAAAALAGNVDGADEQRRSSRAAESTTWLHARAAAEDAIIPELRVTEQLASAKEVSVGRSTTWTPYAHTAGEGGNLDVVSMSGVVSAAASCADFGLQGSGSHKVPVFLVHRAYGYSTASNMV